MKIDYRTIVWAGGGAFLFLILGVPLFKDYWMGGVLVGIGCIIGFELDQYYKKKKPTHKTSKEKVK